MNPIASIIRVVSGLALVILSYSTYHRTFDGVSAGGKLMLFGSETGASAGQLTLAFVVIGLLGVGLLALGVLGFLKSRD